MAWRSEASGLDQTRGIAKWQAKIKEESPGGAGLLANILRRQGAEVCLASPGASYFSKVEKNLHTLDPYGNKDEPGWLPRKNRIYSEQGLEARFDEPGWKEIDGLRHATVLADQAITEATMLVWTDYGNRTWRAGLTPQAVDKAVPKEAFRIVSAKYWETLRGFHRVDVIVANLSEAEALVSSYDQMVYDTFMPCEDGLEPLRRAEFLAKKVFQGFQPSTAVVVTDGKNGSAFWGLGKHGSVVADNTIEADATGAGDAFLAGFVQGFIESADVGLACSRGNSFGAMMASRIGTNAWCLGRMNQYLCSKLQNMETGQALPLASLKSCFLPILRRELENYRWGDKGGRIVATNGCFDLLHLGHQHLLKEAKRQGDYLIVLVDSDESVKSLKGDGRPVQCQQLRVAQLTACPFVDMVIVFKDQNELVFYLDAIQPEVLVKGEEYDGKEIAGQKYARRTHFVKHVTEVSTTATVEKVKGQ